MIPLIGTALAFCAVAYITTSRTYAVLALSSIVNLYIDQFTRADDHYLMVVYSAIEFGTAWAILVFGDKHKIYQSTVLLAMLITHFCMEAALEYDNAWIIESGIYTYTITGLIIAQLMGAGYGVDRISTKPGSSGYRSKNNHLDGVNCEENYLLSGRQK